MLRKFVGQSVSLDTSIFDADRYAASFWMMSYKVFVDDNFHYMDQEHRYSFGEFDTFEAAVAACQRIVDEFLEEAYKPGMKAEELYQVYIGFGEDPFIVRGDIRFSAWDYAKERSAQIALERRD